MHDVVITGIGLVTPMGNTLEAVRATYLEGRSAIRCLPPGPNGRARAAAFIDEDLTAGLPLATVKMLDRTGMMALHASDRAMADAGLERGAFDPTRAGTFIGCGSGSVVAHYDVFDALFRKDSMSALALLRVLPSGPAGHVAIRHGLEGECVMHAVACASAASAIGNAMRLIRWGVLDMAVVGGVEAPLSPDCLRGWEAMRVTAKVDPEHPQAACRPYSLDRSGMVLGEGGALYVIESAAHAKARGARVHARLAGFGASCDARHITLPEARGQAAAMRMALADAGLAPSAIGYINAHGTATPQGDVIETQSVREVFGAGADRLPMSSTKSMHGHWLGASGAIELTAAILALGEGLLPPTINLEVPDPACDLDCVPNRARTGVALDAVMSNSFAFGGSNATLVLTR
jgi:3-oxoacyl-[acyl-carrier-protein] synthase II